ncbi:peroxisomal membrane protein 11C [Trichonephila inaurata madagascariensis]|uniref:Peroxisomal membrane protein 11C n=1 Tax=Trichonephila inaurata madagascariensis TaxID=2747483 RepID=A0A8X6XQN8_9ARAC|nr:peroxisomal membrane protein 11C [Trichonephila inaurata madagascariensis]
MAEGGKINSIIELLDSHRGRDSIIRTASYLSLYLSSYARGNTSRKLKTISEELSYCRLIMRLFDDFPMLHFTLNYGLGSQEKTILMRVLGVVKNLLDQIYYPVEHVAWAAEKRLMKANSYLLYTAGAALWGLSSYISIVRSLIMMSILQRQTKGLKNVVLHEKIVAQQLEYLLMAFKDFADVVLAINYLPPGSLLWAGKLNKKEIGLIGTISSLLRLVMLFRHLKRNGETDS